MTKPAFIVEGILEQRAIARICPDTPVRRLNCNGDAVSIEAITKRTITLYKTLGNRYYPIVVIFDRENRAETSAQIEFSFSKNLQDCGVDASQFVVAVPDRTIENWILGDRTLVESEFYGKPLKDSYEGLHGKNEIRALLQHEIYTESSTGVQLICRIRPSKMSHSESFRRFRAELLTHCRWMQS